MQKPTMGYQVGNIIGQIVGSRFAPMGMMAQPFTNYGGQSGGPLSNGTSQAEGKSGGGGGGGAGGIMQIIGAIAALL